MKWQKKFTWYALAFGIIMAILFFTCGCSATKTITQTEQTVVTTTIQPIKVDVPGVHLTTTIPLIKADTTNPEPYGIYGDTQIIETKNPSGTKHFDTVKVKLNVHKNSAGKPVVDANIQVDQSPIETKGQVTNQTVKTDNKTQEQTFGYTFMKYLVWILLGGALLVVLTIVSYLKGWLTMFGIKK